MAKKALNEEEQKLVVTNAHKNFMLARSEAINFFAQLETYLSKLLTGLLGANMMQGSKLFSEIVNTRARLDLISSLFEIRYGNQHKEFFGSLLSHLESVAGSRNKIVHWLLVTAHTGGKPFNPTTGIYLIEHPDIFKGGKLYIYDVRYFSRKTKFFGLLVFYFDIYLTIPHPEVRDGNPNKRPWQEIFSEKIVYRKRCTAPTWQSPG